MMQLYKFDKAARKWVKADEAPKKRTVRKRAAKAETKEVKPENK